MPKCNIKAVLLFVVIFVAMFSDVYAQNFLNQTARWKQRFSYYGMTNSTTCISERHFNGDTTIAGKQYFLLFYSDHCIRTIRTFDSLGNPIVTYDTTDATSFLGFMREENKKIYIRDVLDNEYLQYNFNISENTYVDSIVHNSSCGPLNSVRVLSSDTVCVGNSIRKRWRVSMSTYPLAFYIIEGIGPSSGFLSPVCRNGCPECGYQLLSFSLNGDTLYNANCLKLGVENDERKDSQSEIFPNPFSNKLSIKSSEVIESIEIKSILGQTIFSTAINSMTTEMETNELPEGIYLLKLKINGKFIVRRIVKQ